MKQFHKDLKLYNLPKIYPLDELKLDLLKLLFFRLKNREQNEIIQRLKDDLRNYINEKNNVSDVKSNSNQVSNNNTNQNLEKSLMKKKNVSEPSSSSESESESISSLENN